MGKCSQDIKWKVFLLSCIYNGSQFHRNIKYAYALTEQGYINTFTVVITCGCFMCDYHFLFFLHLFSSFSKMSILILWWKNHGIKILKIIWLSYMYPLKT